MVFKKCLHPMCQEEGRSIWRCSVSCRCLCEFTLVERERGEGLKRDPGLRLSQPMSRALCLPPSQGRRMTRVVTAAPRVAEVDGMSTCDTPG